MSNCTVYSIKCTLIFLVAFLRQFSMFNRTSTIHRWVLDRECKTLQLAGVPKIITWYMGRRIDKVCHGQGIGRHSHEELEHISKTDFKALSDFLGMLIAA